jgi:Lrp/AsnC family leucine-responsive transcriptional regulator
MSFSNERNKLVADDLDLRILQELSRNPELTYKELGGSLRVDQRTVAKRVLVMKQEGVLTLAVEINWARLGVAASAYVGSTTAAGEKEVARLHEFFRSNPRVVEAFKTIGAHQYLFRILDTDIQTLRDSVLHDLEPLTADLTTSLISSTIKERDYSPFLQLLREKLRRAS